MTRGDSVMARLQARVGTTINAKYRLDALLGVGGMAAVYAATHRNGDRVALKVLHSELSRMDGIRARFLREGYVANKIGHASVVRVIDDDAAPDGCVYLLLPELEPDMVQVVDVALAFDPRGRWQTAGAMGNALRYAAGRTSAVPAAAAPGSHPAVSSTPTLIQGSDSVPRRKP